MGFVQFVPLKLSEPGLPTISTGEPFPKEARVINEDGEDAAKKHGLPTNLNEAANAYRDQLSIALSMEMKRGRVYIDYTGVPEEQWENPPLNKLQEIHSDFRCRPFCVAPATHFFMGGVEIDVHAQTAIPGLFAAGEVAVGVHGANRHGGNALTECFVFGDIAGESAARYALGPGRERSNAHPTGGDFSWEDKTGRVRTLFRELQDLMWAHAGPIRNAESLREGLARISHLETQLTRLDVKGRSVALHEVSGSLLISKAIMRAALEREESRGAHYREDFPQRNDANWLKRILLKLDHETGDFILSYKALTPSNYTPS
jgi:succinate dehydrogenase/fumarate reductase flavoprotein subunit